jgi:hypothetical protein
MDTLITLISDLEIDKEQCPNHDWLENTQQIDHRAGAHYIYTFIAKDQLVAFMDPFQNYRNKNRKFVCFDFFFKTTPCNFLKLWN